MGVLAVLALIYPENKNKIKSLAFTGQSCLLTTGYHNYSLIFHKRNA
jgi:hypothetical protein